MQVNAWADGFGNWHAVVPLSNDEKSNRQLAQAAILWQLNDRQPAIRVTRKALPVRLVETNYVIQTAHYTEVA